jgi:hypothetical protein
VKKYLTLSILSALLLPAAAFAHSDKGKGSFLAIDLPTQTYPSPLDAAKSLINAFPESMEGEPKMEITMRKRPKLDELKMIVTVDGLLDDSVSAKQYSVGLKQGVDGWAMTILGERWKCGRSKKRNKWTIEKCF